MENNLKFNSQESDLNKKTKIWNEKMSQMLTPDVYGYVLDEKIRETIVALNLLGINTTQSDQGNYSDSPWIQFEAPQPENYYIGESELRANVLAQKNLQPEVMDKNSSLFDRSTQVDIWAASRDELMKNGAEYTPEFLKYLEDTQNMAEKLQGFIDEYYANAVDMENKEMRVEISYPYNNSKYALYLHKLPRLQVSVPEHSKSKEEGKILVTQTQTEMLKFTEYLKHKFFANQ